MNVAGSMTHTPYTLAKRRSASRSFSTPFWAHDDVDRAGRVMGELLERRRSVLTLHRQDDERRRRRVAT